MIQFYRYPTARALMSALESCATAKEAEALVSTSVGEYEPGRRVGPAVSKVIAWLYGGRDELK